MQNKWPILKGNLALQLCFVALLLYTCLLPFQPFFPPITSGIVAFWLVYVLSFQKERLLLLHKNKFAWLWMLYYAFVLAGLFYTNNPSEAEKDLVLKISLLLWPLGFATWQEPIVKYRHAILSVFSWTSVISSAALIAVGISRWLATGLPSSKLFQYMNVWESIPNHYIALYASFSVFIFIQLLLNKKLKFWVAALGISVLLALLALTSVRIQFIALPLAGISFLLFQKMVPALKRRLAIGIIAGFLLVFLMAFLVPSSKNRILETVDELRSINGLVNEKQTNHRVYLWKFGAEVISENFWFGTGTGASDFALNEKLKTCDAKFWDGNTHYKLIEKKFNYHNVFLQHFATHGVFALFVLIALFVLPFLLSKGEVSALGVAFLTLCFVSFLTESMLERQAGVLFFGFFYALFFVPKSSITGK